MIAGHAAVVLGAGGSRRLGDAKQLLLRDGETLIRRVVRLLGETRPRRLVVVLGADAESVVTALAGAGGDVPIDVRINPAWESGLSTSLQCAARALREHAGAVLIAGCDQPALALHHLRELLAGAGLASSGCAATRHGDRLGPPVVIPSALLQEAHALAGDRGFGERLNRLAAGTVWTLDAPELQLDIDTRNDEQAAIARGLLDVPGPAG